jgi:cytochrome c oxidase assembly protein subunit 15
VNSRSKSGVKNEQPLALSFALLGIIIFQAALGMWTVTMGLLPIIVMGHLIGGFVTLTLLLILFLNIKHGNPVAWASPVRTAALLGVVIVLIQIILGGWTSANYAAIICADFPTCQGAMIPPLDFSGAFTISTDGVSSYLGGHLDNISRVTIQWMHRLGALITTLYLCFLIFKLFASGWTKFALLISVLLIAQVSLGISNVVFSLPLAVAVAHNGVAVLLLMSLAALVHYSGMKKLR